MRVWAVAGERFMNPQHSAGKREQNESHLSKQAIQEERGAHSIPALSCAHAETRPGYIALLANMSAVMLSYQAMLSARFCFRTSSPSPGCEMKAPDATSLPSCGV